MGKKTTLAELKKYTREAVRFYWETRTRQIQKQREAGGSDQGFRSAVTGGAQMDGFIELLTKLVLKPESIEHTFFTKIPSNFPDTFAQINNGISSSL